MFFTGTFENVLSQERDGPCEGDAGCGAALHLISILEGARLYILIKDFFTIIDFFGIFGNF